MMWRLLYNAIAIPALYVGFHTAAKFSSKVRLGIAGRRGAVAKLETQLKSAAPRNHTVWFHFTSVGEFEQAKPLIEAIKDEVRIALTYFSPSVHASVERFPYCDASTFLPLDTRHNAETLLKIIKPSLLIFSKFDIWPNLVWSASQHQVPVVLIAGTLRAKSKRLSFLARPFFKNIHQHISIHCTISELDSERFRQICPPEAQIEIAGDTRFDSVYHRAMAVNEKTQFFPGQSTLNRHILIAGSTYLEDERVLLDAYSLLTQHSPHLLAHLVLVPHEPTEERIRQIERRLNHLRLSHCRFSNLTSDVNLCQTETIIIDAVGLLAELYWLGDVAFVGGGFHGSIHNVMEPAALGKPILFGPTIDNAYEADMLQEAGAARTVKNANEMADVLTEWLTDSRERERRGQIGKSVIGQNLGASERTLEHLKPYLRSHSQHRAF